MTALIYRSLPSAEIRRLIGLAYAEQPQGKGFRLGHLPVAQRRPQSLSSMHAEGRRAGRPHRRGDQIAVLFCCSALRRDWHVATFRCSASIRSLSEVQRTCRRRCERTDTLRKFSLLRGTSERWNPSAVGRTLG